MSRPRVSVLMPIYNCERYLDQAVQSVRDQTLRDFEFVVVNDGSTDSSLGILRRHAAEDPRIVVIDRPNGGIVRALNTGLDHCEGGLVARLDGDDYATPDRLERQLATIEEDAGLSAVSSPVINVSEDGEPLGITRHPVDHETIDAALLECRCGLIHGAAMLRREAVEAVGRYRQECCFAEDLDLFLRLAEYGRLKNSSEPLTYVRSHSESTSKTRALEQCLATRRGVADAMKRRGIRDRDTLSVCARNVSRRMADEGRLWGSWIEALHSIGLTPGSSRGYRAAGRTVLKAVAPRSLFAWLQATTRGRAE